MQLRLKDHVLLQKQPNGKVSVLDSRSIDQGAWVASGLAADALLLIQKGISKDDLVEALKCIYNGSQTEIEKSLNRFLTALSRHGMLTKKGTKAFGLKDILFKSKKPSLKMNPQKPRKKKKIVFSFKKETLAENLFLVAYASGEPCLSDADCLPGDHCTISADMCTQFCYST